MNTNPLNGRFVRRHNIDNFLDGVDSGDEFDEDGFYKIRKKKEVKDTFRDTISHNSNINNNNNNNKTEKKINHTTII